MKKVQVLMSTYNGEKYLKEQIDSIISQKGVEIHILVRDDGSKDNTINILKEYENIEIIEGNNLGVCKSFFELINLSGDYDYYSFADQDDVWDNDKLFMAIKLLEQNEKIPAVYSSNTKLVDENLNFLKDLKENPKLDLGSAFIKNYCIGCTMVFNKILMGYLKNNLPDYAPMHDWWVNLVCLSLGGKSYFDNKSYINYRQHGRNVLGAESNFYTKMKRRWQKFLGEPYHRDLMAKEILLRFDKNIKNDNALILKEFADPSIRLIFNRKIKTNSIFINVLFKVCIIFNKI